MRTCSCDAMGSRLSLRARSRRMALRTRCPGSCAITTSMSPRGEAGLGIARALVGDHHQPAEVADRAQRLQGRAGLRAQDVGRDDVRMADDGVADDAARAVRVAVRLERGQRLEARVVPRQHPVEAEPALEAVARVHRLRDDEDLAARRTGEAAEETGGRGAGGAVVDARRSRSCAASDWAETNCTTSTPRSTSRSIASRTCGDSGAMIATPSTESGACSAITRATWCGSSSSDPQVAHQDRVAGDAVARLLDPLDQRLEELVAVARQQEDEAVGPPARQVRGREVPHEAERVDRLG